MSWLPPHDIESQTSEMGCRCSCVPIRMTSSVPVSSLLHIAVCTGARPRGLLHPEQPGGVPADGRPARLPAHHLDAAVPPVRRQHDLCAYRTSLNGTMVKQAASPCDSASHSSAAPRARPLCRRRQHYARHADARFAPTAPRCTQQCSVVKAHNLRLCEAAGGLRDC